MKILSSIVFDEEIKLTILFLYPRVKKLLV